MDRCRDYIGFAIRYFGLSYLVLWPFSTPDRGELFGARFVCGGMLDTLCRLPHPLQFGAGLHLAGAICAFLACGTLAVRALARAWPRRAAAKPPEVAAPAAPPTKRMRRRPMPPPHRLVRPRSHFGLRGVPH